jgi:hypothetical protein
MPLAAWIVAAIVLFFVLDFSAAAQHQLTKDRIRHVNKVTMTLAHYGTGTQLNVEFSGGSRHIGTLSEIGSLSFILVDPVSHKPETIDDLDVKRVQPTPKKYMQQQLVKTVKGLPAIAVCVLIVVLVIVVVSVL